MSTQPNFLYIITDQHRFDWLGLAGHPVVKTPNIDAIAQGGTVFRNFFVANPVCMPNRASLLTGRYSSINGVRANGTPLPLNANTFAKALAGAGYDTAAFGKLHLQTLSNIPAADPTEEHDDPAREAKTFYTLGNYGNEAMANWPMGGGGAGAMDLPYYGFKEVELVTLHGDVCEGHYGNWLRAQRADADSLRGPQNQLPHSYSCPQAIRTALPEELYHSSYIGRQTVEFLKDPARRAAPFFAFVSFPDPHHPFNPPGKYWDMYDPDEFDVPENFDAPHQTRLIQFLKEVQGTIRTLHMGANPVSKREVQEAMALSAGMITMIDDCVGEILAALKAAGLAENTIIAFNSDHGELMGDHGLLFKGPLHCDPVVHVPMIWNDPRVAQVPVCDGIGSTIDIAPTILAAADVAPYHGLQGIDLGPAMQGADIGRRATLIEDEFLKPMIYDGLPKVRTLRTRRHRLTLVIGEEDGELYDLEADPKEMKNLFNDPAAAELKASLLAELVHLMGDATDRSPRAIQQA